MAPPPEENLGFWHGQMSARLDKVDESIKRLDATMDLVKKEIVESNIRMAKYIGGIAVLLALVTMLAPTVTEILFGVRP